MLRMVRKARARASARGARGCSAGASRAGVAGRRSRLRLRPRRGCRARRHARRSCPVAARPAAPHARSRLASSPRRHRGVLAAERRPRWAGALPVDPGPVPGSAESCLPNHWASVTTPAAPEHARKHCMLFMSGSDVNPMPIICPGRRGIGERERGIAGDLIPRLRKLENRAWSAGDRRPRRRRHSPRASMLFVRVLYVPSRDVRTAFFCPVTVKKMVRTPRISTRVLSSNTYAVSP